MVDFTFAIPIGDADSDVAGAMIAVVTLKVS